jgi:hypothetical protein
MSALPSRCPPSVAVVLCLALSACSYDFDGPFDGAGGGQGVDGSVGGDAQTDQQVVDQHAEPPIDVPGSDSHDGPAESDVVEDAPTDTPGSDVACTAPQKLCGSACVNMDDPAYGCSPDGCAPCVSGEPHATVACANGSCVLGACAPGWDDCDNDATNGCETNTDSEKYDCGGCGVACTIPHSSEECVGGTCTFVSCVSGYDNCNGVEADGCESDLDDPSTCGSCFNACASPPHATAQCSGDTCSFNCTGDYEDCNSDSSDGCEADLSGPANCHGCGNVCPTESAPHLVPACDWLVGCTSVCETGWGNCDGDWTNGCECPK